MKFSEYIRYDTTKILAKLFYSRLDWFTVAKLGAVEWLVAKLRKMDEMHTRNKLENFLDIAFNPRLNTGHGICLSSGSFLATIRAVNEFSSNLQYISDMKQGTIRYTISRRARLFHAPWTTYWRGGSLHSRRASCWFYNYSPPRMLPPLIILLEYWNVHITIRVL